MNASSVVLVTASRLPNGMEDSAGLLDALHAQGVGAELRPWTDPNVAWQRFDRILLHAPWDYTEHIDRFDQWIDAADSGQLLNSARLTRWNTDKRYLCALADQGIPIPRTVTVARGADARVEELTDRLGTGRLVVKSVIGAGGRRTWLMKDARAAVDFMTGEAGSAQGALLVQAYEPAVESEGEYSAVHFGGELSHVVRKIPARGEFRVQDHYGGQVQAVSTEAWMADFSAQLMASLPEPAAYARIDFVIGQEGTPLLMEAELIEPDLFLRYGKDAYTRFARFLAS